jgi:acetyl-CoA carboxylase carboxyltransferase component
MKTIPQDWQALLDELNTRKTTASSMGGQNKLEKRALSGRLNAREFIELLVDKNSQGQVLFQELGALVGSLSHSGLPPANADALIGGKAVIDGQSVIIGVEDFTVQGGSIGHGTNAKRLRLASLALQEGCPYIIVLDGAGARMTNGLERHPYAPNDLQVMAQLSGQVPTAAIVLGSSAGHGALTGLMTDFIIMLEDATMFSAGPPLVAAALGELVSKEALGGALMHCSQSGVAHNLAADETEACLLLKQYLSYLCLTNQASTDSKRRLDDIYHQIPCNGSLPYDIKPVIASLADQCEFFEYQPLYGKAIVTGFMRMEGQTVAVIANQPNIMAGAIDHTAAIKAADFIATFSHFDLPFLFLADNPGIMSGTQAERAGTLKAAAKMYKAQANIRSKKIHVTLRKAFGFGSSLMAMNPFDKQSLSIAFPGISLGGIPVLGGNAAANIDTDTETTLSEQERTASWSTADNMAFDDIIDPGELRNTIISAL